MHGHTIAVLSPEGMIASKERSLIFFATALSLVVVIPVFILLFSFVWKYREDNTSASYTPDWSHNSALELVWWAIPLVLIIILSVVTWQSSHQLDPYRTISSTTPPMTIQVVALQWKWLFIYPDQNIATVNYFRIPENTPINFEITSDAPMNSFWLPQLGGQVYAMSGMITHLHLVADKTGMYHGSSANISGSGFASMKFVAQSSSNDDFNAWVSSVKQAPNALTFNVYNSLVKPSTTPVTNYSSTAIDLYDTIVMKYMPLAAPEAVTAAGTLSTQGAGR